MEPSGRVPMYLARREPLGTGGKEDSSSSDSFTRCATRGGPSSRFGLVFAGFAAVVVVLPGDAVGAAAEAVALRCAVVAAVDLAGEASAVRAAGASDLVLAASATVAGFAAGAGACGATSAGPSAGEAASDSSPTVGAVFDATTVGRGVCDGTEACVVDSATGGGA